MGKGSTELSGTQGTKQSSSGREEVTSTKVKRTSAETQDFQAIITKMFQKQGRTLKKKKNLGVTCMKTPVGYLLENGSCNSEEK